MFFEGAPIKYVKIGKVGGKPSVVFVPNGDVFTKVEDEKGGIAVYSSFDKFSKIEKQVEKNLKQLFQPLIWLV